MSKCPRTKISTFQIHSPDSWACTQKQKRQQILSIERPLQGNFSICSTYLECPQMPKCPRTKISTFQIHSPDSWACTQKQMRQQILSIERPLIGNFNIFSMYKECPQMSKCPRIKISTFQLHSRDSWALTQKQKRQQISSIERPLRGNFGTFSSYVGCPQTPKCPRTKISTFKFHSPDSWAHTQKQKSSKSQALKDL